MLPMGINSLGLSSDGCLEATSCVQYGISSDPEVVEDSEALDTWPARLAVQQQPRGTRLDKCLLVPGG